MRKLSTRKKAQRKKQALFICERCGNISYHKTKICIKCGFMRRIDDS